MAHYHDGLNAQTWAALNPTPSTRESTSLLTKWYPVNKLLAVPGTAEDLYTVTPLQATVNMVTNPSFEIADGFGIPVGYLGIDADFTRDATYAKYGSYSAKIEPDNVAAGEGMCWEIGKLPGRADNRLPLSISCYFRRAAGGPTVGEDARVVLIAENTTPFYDSSLPVPTRVNYLNGTTVTLTNSWQRSTVSTEIDTSDTYWAYLITATKHGVDFWADGLQVETLNSPTDYCDGDQSTLSGNVNCSWDGTSHASASRRLKAMGSIRNLTLHTDKSIYLCYDGIATATNGRLLEADSTMWLDYPCYILKNISFINAETGQFPHVTGEIWGA
jgi:hypothetical protein